MINYVNHVDMNAISKLKNHNYDNQIAKTCSVAKQIFLIDY